MMSLIKAWLGHPLARDIVVALGIFLLFRGATASVGFLAACALPEQRLPIAKAPYPLPRPWELRIWQRWDANWYAEIATKGYRVGEGQTAMAFFPLLPLASRPLIALGVNPYVAGMVIANLCTLLGLVALKRLGERLADEAVGWRAGMVALAFPTSLFLSLNYAEGPFFLFLTLALLGAERSSPVQVGLWGMAAVLTRSNGFLLVPPVVLLLWQRSRGTLSWRWIWLLAIPLGLALHGAYLAWSVGDPLAFLKAQAAWGRGLTWPWEAVISGAREVVQPCRTDMPANAMLDLAALVVMTGLGIAALFHRRLGPAYGLCILLFTLSPLCTGSIMSMKRFAAVLSPAFLLLAMVTANRPRAYSALIHLFAVLQGLLVALYVNWYFAG